MDESTLWGLAIIVYIAIVVPKYLIASGEIDKTIKEPAPFDRLMISWIIGFLVLLIFCKFNVKAIPSFLPALVVFGGSFFAMKMFKIRG